VQVRAHSQAYFELRANRQLPFPGFLRIAHDLEGGEKECNTKTFHPKRMRETQNNNGE
jgi:hypothetical protein